MSAQPWPQPADPRRTVRVRQARVRLSGQPGLDAQPSALVWQQRIEDALRCAHFGSGSRFVLLRKLQVRAGSAAAPGWAGVIEAAAQDAVARARHGRSAGADGADAVWFDSWDDAMAAWLDSALRWPALHVSPQAWFWPRIAKTAGLPMHAAPLAPAASLADGVGAHAIEQAQAMLTRWQADPASRRACDEWFAQRPAFRELLRPQGAAPSLSRPEAATDAPRSDVAGRFDRPLAADAQSQTGREKVRERHDDVRGEEASMGMQRARDGSPRDAAVEAGDQTNSMPASSKTAPEASGASTRRDAQVASQPADLNADVAQSINSAQADDMPASHADLPSAGLRDVAHGLTPTTQAAIPAERPEPATSALGWTHLRRTHFGGLPLTINALQRLGFGDELDAVSASLDQASRWIAASAPWLAVWARMSPVARQRWVRDPMFAALPAFDAVADLPVQDRAHALFARWHAQPAAVRRLGRRLWRRLQRAAQSGGWRSPRVLLQRQAWMQLSATHLDVIFTFDQADLAVRRFGLDTDPGWVPWLGRIVSLHFEPADQLPSWSAP